MLTDYIDVRTANIYGIYGNLGGGKTLTSVEIALWALRRGWRVSSNVHLKNLKHNPENYTFIPDFQEVDFWNLPLGAPRGHPSTYRSVIIIDEVAEFFDQYSYSSNNARRFLSWLRHSSKQGQFVFLIVQRPEFLNKSIRILVNKWIICDDLDQVRLPVVKLKLPFCRDYVMRKIIDRWSNVISRGFNMASKSEIGYFYDTSQSIALEGRDQNFIIPEEPERKNDLYDFVLLLIAFYIITQLF